MRKLQTGLAAAAIAAAFAIASMPANAAPLFIQKTVTAPSDIIQVRHRRWVPAAGAFVAGALIGGAIASSNNYYGGYYGDRYYGDRYYDGYYPRYYAPARIYYPPVGSSYRAGYRAGYHDGYYSRRYYNDITCTERLESAGKC